MEYMVKWEGSLSKPFQEFQGAGLGGIWSPTAYKMFINPALDLFEKKNNLALTYREKEGDLTQSYDKTPYTNRKFENQRTTHKRHQKLRLHNDCGPT